MKQRYFKWIMSLALIVCFAIQSPSEELKEEVIQAKSGTIKALNPGQQDLQKLDQHFGKLYRSQNRPAQKSNPSSNLLDWAKSERSLQVLNRPEAKVYTHLKRGVVAVEPPEGKRYLSASKANTKPQKVALDYVAENYSIFGIENPETELLEDRCQKDSLEMTHLFFKQHYAGIPIWGRQLIAHLDAKGALKFINCVIQPGLKNLESLPRISADESIEIAKARLEAEGNPVTLTEKQADFYGFEPVSSDLYYWQKAPLCPVELSWVVEIRPNVQDWMRFFIRATDGEILEFYNATNFADGPRTAQVTTINSENVTINTYQIGDKYYLIDGTRQMFVAGQTGDQLKNDPKGVVWTLDLRNQDLTDQASFYYVQSDNNTWTNQTNAVTAHYYAGLVYNYYRNLNNINRNSFDNDGKSMMALVSVARNGQPMDNAFWNGAFVSLGDGQQITTSWAGAKDFVAHEFTHAHVQYTANLEYKFQSGALNETFADIGGVSVDNEDFLLGEDIVVQQYFPSGAMRNMGNPHNGGTGPNDYTWQPAHMNEYQDMTLENDNGGVHVNNGITNFAAYKILTGLGRAKGEQVLFRALVNYLGQQSNFTDFRLAAVKSAQDLYGAGSTEETKVKQAFDEVGIVEGSGTQPPEDTPPVSGLQYILMVNELDEYWNPENSLLITDPFSNTSEVSVPHYLNANYSQVNIRSGRPIAVDPYGQAIYFVDSTYNLHTVKPNGSEEAIISNSGDWWSVALSPSGRRLAMTRNIDENKIFVYDFAENPPAVQELTLLHPTTDHNNAYADVVNFADSLVFLDDQLLFYDCYNSVQSPGEGTLNFWDVNVIDVVSGQIFAILPPQRAGVNIVNPILASTNKTILGVEVFEQGVQNEIYGINLSTGVANVILNNGLGLGFPDYSVDDDFLLFSRTNFLSYQDIYYIPLEDNKISASGDAGSLFSYTQLPIWFAQGTPPTASVEFSATTSSVGEGNPTFNIPVSLSETSNDTITVDYSVTGGNAIGNGVDYTLENGRLTFNPQESSQNIVLTVVDDSLTENDETLILTLSRPVNAWMGQKTTHTLTILDNDQAQVTATPTIHQPTLTPTPTGGQIPPVPTVLDERADIDDNGIVDYEDLIILQQNWQRSNPGSGGRK